MGFFGKLFDKKICSICGGEIGLLGNRKLEDGNLCKACNSKLSPFFDERRHTTVEGIQEHLDYRAANKEDLKNFHPTRSMGVQRMLHVDEAARTFIVTSSKNWRDENPDIVPMADIADVRTDIQDYKTELKREVKKKDGTTESVSYDPPRYRYTYNFYLEIIMNEDFKWFNKIRIALNTSSIEVEPQPSGFLRAGGLDPHSNPKYCEAERLAQEMTQLLMAGRPGYSQEPEAAPADDGMVTCEYCGSKFASDGSGKCPYCGANVF